MKNIVAKEKLVAYGTGRDGRRNMQTRVYIGISTSQNGITCPHLLPYHEEEEDGWSMARGAKLGGRENWSSGAIRKYVEV
jgi:hypothetical protein